MPSAPRTGRAILICDEGQAITSLHPPRTVCGAPRERKSRRKRVDKKFGIGQPVPRVEDPRFITGRGRYVDDIDLPRQCHGVVLMSPHAHARIKRIDTAKAKAAAGRARRAHRRRCLGRQTRRPRAADARGHGRAERLPHAAHDPRHRQGARGRRPRRLRRRRNARRRRATPPSCSRSTTSRCRRSSMSRTRSSRARRRCGTRRRTTSPSR